MERNDDHFSRISRIFGRHIKNVGQHRGIIAQLCLSSPPSLDGSRSITYSSVDSIFSDGLKK